MFQLQDPRIMFQRIRALRAAGKSDRAIAKELGIDGAPWRFGTDDPVSFLGELGWRAQLSQPGDFAPTRWPFPSVPLLVPNVPRGYYATAERS